MLRIESVAENAHSVTYAVAGDIDSAHLPVLREIVEKARRKRRRVVLDLKEVTLVDRESLHFLAAARQAGLQLAHCPAYVRKWVEQERRASTLKRRKMKD
jgi:anti-anti-sigma regulatory factor